MKSLRNLANIPNLDMLGERSKNLNYILIPGMLGLGHQPLNIPPLTTPNELLNIFAPLCLGGVGIGIFLGLFYLMGRNMNR